MHYFNDIFVIVVIAISPYLTGFALNTLFNANLNDSSMVAERD